MSNVHFPQGFEDSCGDGPGYLWYYCVAELLDGLMVHPFGNPIMPSTHEGQTSFQKIIDKPICFPKL